MAVDPATIVKGKCYLVSGNVAKNQVRHVLDVDATHVFYEARGHLAIPRGRPWGSKTKKNKQGFADAMEKEVSFDYDPEVESSKPSSD